MTETAKSLENIVSLETASKSLFGVEDYTEELQEAHNQGKFIIKYHNSVWDGFETMTGLSQAEYEPLVKKGLQQLNKKVAINEYIHKHIPFLAK